jgi:predicted O-methyltransferase YrrM
MVPQLQDNFFDIIYIDGNHEPEYVLEDAVLSFRKLKVGGILIFDDYGWGGPDLTKKGIDGFLSGYHKRITFLGEKITQVFVRKIR